MIGAWPFVKFFGADTDIKKILISDISADNVSRVGKVSLEM